MDTLALVKHTDYKILECCYWIALVELLSRSAALVAVCCYAAAYGDFIGGIYA